MRVQARRVLAAQFTQCMFKDFVDMRWIIVQIIDRGMNQLLVIVTMSIVLEIISIVLPSLHTFIHRSETTLVQSVDE